MAKVKQFYGKGIPELMEQYQEEVNVAYNQIADNGFPTQRRTGLRGFLWRLMLRFR